MLNNNKHQCNNKTLSVCNSALFSFSAFFCIKVKILFKKSMKSQPECNYRSIITSSRPRLHTNAP